MDIRRLAGFWGSIMLLGLVVTATVAQVIRPMPVPHDLAGRDDCLMCHQVGAMDAVTEVPPSHADRANKTCMWCHGADSPLQTTDPALILHDLAGRDDCLMCHAPGAMEGVTETPANHEGRESSDCMMCHRQAD
jgi:hypothetical protein